MNASLQHLVDQVLAHAKITKQEVSAVILCVHNTKTLTLARHLDPSFGCKTR